MFRTELDETHSKLKALQELAASVNNDLTTLSEIVSRLDDSHTIDPGSYVEKEDGYEVSFRDGTTIFIHFGEDGIDGRTLIPIGVLQDEDSLYYWTVDGDWLWNPDSTKMRAGATDGKNGIVPQIRIYEDMWQISVDDGASFTDLASCDEMNGVGVFSGIDMSDPTKVVLTLVGGTVLEIPCQTSFKMSFSGPAQDTVLIAGGELLPIEYELLVEGEASQPIVVTSGTDGTYLSMIEEGSSPGKGVVKVQAPEEYSEGYILLTANCGGYSAIKMISFQKRQITPEEDTVTVRLPSGNFSRIIGYDTNFEYTVSSDGTWLEVESDPEGGKLTFTASENKGSTVRSCTVKVSPKDNPGYTCTTFQVLQATDKLTYAIGPGSPFIFDPDTKTLDVPSEGGDADIWITFQNEIAVTGTEGVEWAKSELSSVEGFYRLAIHVDPNESEESRQEKLLIKLKTNDIIIGEIKIIQR
ncbi:MAG: hypothetical protein IK076_01865 [Bacteroidales bacterium]|nr:hypothetical protein [Bacteroidales bacterium]